jgi:hypothetical protein
MSGNRSGIIFGGMLALALGIGLVSATPAGAVVYCGRPGYPAGCVARPVATPGAGARGVGVLPGAGAGAAGAGLAPGAGVGAPGVGAAPANRGGPVNRLGVR